MRGADLPTRREFVSMAARGLLGVAAMPFLPRALAQSNAGREITAGVVPTAHRAIYVYLSGGLSHLDTFDPKPGNDAMGPMQTIGTNVDGIRVGQFLPRLARQMDKVCVVRSMWSNQGAHEQGRYFMHTSYALRGTIRHPSLGAWLGSIRGSANPTLPSHVTIGGDAFTAQVGFLGSQFAPLPIGDPEAGLQNAARADGIDEATFRRRIERLQQMNERFLAAHGSRLGQAYDEAYAQAVELMGSRDLLAFDLGQESAALRDAYGRERVGQACLLARRLVEHDVRFVEVVVGGWDTHNENFEALEERLPPLDQALAALLADLDARGLLEETLVVVATEFGRTPQINDQRNGRDHHPKAFSCLLAGGGIRGGHVHGSTDARGEEITAGRVTVADFNATIATALGLPVDEVYHSPSGRPFQVANKGQPVREVFA
ncbi:MAG: DUF1501 domain-containing protein [Planctomycetes bacterium]|nr:DUF1501 domain-containing protein [Planctomycetota bacterium]